jgi:aminoglycoside phosphotransferase (APT) family kinase protein
LPKANAKHWRVSGWRGPADVRKFRGRQSNPTYRPPGGAYVLRKKPVLPPSAHAIDREHRAISAVRAAGYPAPKPILHCEDDEVIGTAFYLVDYIDGPVFWDMDIRASRRPSDRRSMTM